MLEITETSVLENIPAAKLSLSRLRDIGVSVALDDFGTGFSSFSLVKDLPLTCIKIDRSFISGADDTSHTSSFVKSIVMLCDGYGLSPIAEGIETEQQRNLLLANGCRNMQGYLFGRPSAALLDADENGIVQSAAAGRQRPRSNLISVPVAHEGRGGRGYGRARPRP